MIKRILLLAFGLLLTNPLLALDEEELLHPDEAFKLSLSVEGENQILARWDIADAYYMYRDKIEISATNDAVVLGEITYPAGKIKQDAYFGEVETYRHSASVTIPVLLHDGNVELTIKSQGCADLGVCYPPQTKTLSVDLPKAAPSPVPTSLTAAEPKQSPLDILAGLANKVTGGGSVDEDELLEPEKAFFYRFQPIRGADEQPTGEFIARWDIAEGYYLYRDKIKFELESYDEGFVISEPQFPKGITQQDAFFGEVEVYRGFVEVPLTISNSNPRASDFAVTAHYQGCADIGVCYPPMQRETIIQMDLLGVSQLSEEQKERLTRDSVESFVLDEERQVLLLPTEEKTEQTEKTAAITSTTSDGALSEQDALAAKLSSGNQFLTLLTFFGLGLLLAFTPCVFPMIPILSGIIIGQGEKVTPRRAFLLSLTYVLAMALTYTIVGVLAGLFGANIQIWFQNPWVLSVFAGVFVLLSLAMFGFYELQMPNSVQSYLNNLSNKQEGGKYTGAAIMGFLSALIVGPCVTAPLIGALIYIGQTGDALLGGSALFMLSMGMGVPLLLIGASAGTLLPRAGGWMDVVKGVFGVMLLGVAIWLLERILPFELIMALVAILLMVSAIYMGALEPIPAARSGWFKLWKGLGIVLLLQGSLILIGLAAGGKSLITPIKGVFGGGEIHQQAHLAFEPIKGLSGLEQVLEQAKSQNQPVMLDFYADWCVSCKEMEALTFTDQNVIDSLAGARVIQADVTANDAQDAELLKHFGLFGPPAILFFDGSGVEQASYRVVGFKGPEEFAAHVNKALPQ